MDSLGGGFDFVKEKDCCERSPRGSEMDIPKCIHPLSKYWIQPENKEVLIDDIHALMSKDSLKQLHEYSMSCPTGVYEGKMWKWRKYRTRDDEWFLRWYEEDKENNKMCNIKTRLILLV